jgi:hypothetical protein
MADFKVRSDHVDVEQIMQQIRERIREKRGVDYTEEQVRELAQVKLERFLDPRNVRSDLVEHYRRQRTMDAPLETFEFEDVTIYQSHRMPLLRAIRRILNPLLKLFFNPNPIIRALHLQSRINDHLVRRSREIDALNFEIVNNLVVELTRVSIEARQLRMRLESMSARLDFDERRARALEGVVQYRPDAEAGSAESEEDDEAEGRDEGREGDAARRRRRRRRGRRRPGGAEAGDSEQGERRAQEPVAGDRAPQTTGQEQARQGAPREARAPRGDEPPAGAPESNDQ